MDRENEIEKYCKAKVIKEHTNDVLMSFTMLLFLHRFKH